MSLYAKLGAFVAWTLLVVFLTHRYDEGRGAIKENERTAAVAEHKDKVETTVGAAVILNQATVVYEVERVRTVYRDIYKEAVEHEKSGNDAFPLSVGWVQIHDDGASATGVPEDTEPGPVDVHADSGITAAQALPSIIENYEADAIVRRKLSQCLGFVRALKPFYKSPLPYLETGATIPAATHAPEAVPGEAPAP